MNSVNYTSFFFFFFRFYFIHKRHTETDRDRQREKQAPYGEPDVGLHPRTLGSRPEPKADAQPLSHPGTLSVILIFKIVIAVGVREDTECDRLFGLTYKRNQRAEGNRQEGMSLAESRGVRTGWWHSF